MKKWFAALLLAAVVLVAPVFVVQACGPFFYPDVFVYKLHPDHPKDYAAGKLGVLLSTYPRADLFVAWRYLNGGSLTAEEQKGYHPLDSYAEVEMDWLTEDASRQQRPPNEYAQEPSEADAWLKARNGYAPPQPEIQTYKQYGMIYTGGLLLSGSYENCQRDAFRVATATLTARAKKWGGKSPELAEWIKGQDAVFSHCNGATANSYSHPENAPRPPATEPGSLPESAPLLLRQDRAYQQAAAKFYAGAFEPAEKEFRSIAQDASSPWRGVARYMVARTLVREAFLSTGAKDDAQATFNPALMKQAQSELESLQHEKLPRVSAHAVQQMLNLVRYRTEPEKRLRELVAALASAETDPEYGQDLIDLNLHLNAKLDETPLRADAEDQFFNVDKAANDYTPLNANQKAGGYEKAYQNALPERALGEMVDWAISMQSPSSSAKQHALAEWKRTAHMPWLLASLVKASAADADAPVLLAAAANVPANSPAFVTAAYHRIRLLADAGTLEEARAVLLASQPAFEASGSEGAMNLLAGLRMRTATTLDAALAEAPRKVLLRSSEEYFAVHECLAVMKNPRRTYDCKKITSTTEFDSDAVAVLNQEMPLTTLIATAESTKLPTEQRDAVARMTWVRAVLLGDEAAAAKVFPLLPEKLRQQAGSGVGFRPLMAVLRNPGLRPYLNSGTQRSRSYDFVESYSDNWWCANWHTTWDSGAAQQTAGTLGFLSADLRAVGRKQVEALRKLGSSDEVLGSRVVDYAHAHPNDPDVPEALFLVLRMYRYGCGEGWENSKSPEAAGRAQRVAATLTEVGRLMRHKYPASPWTKKAAPYGGLTVPGSDR